MAENAYVFIAYIVVNAHAIQYNTFMKCAVTMYIYMIVQHQFASSIIVIAQAPFKSSLHAPYINQYRK